MLIQLSETWKKFPSWKFWLYDDNWSVTASGMHNMFGLNFTIKLPLNETLMPLSHISEWGWGVYKNQGPCVSPKCLLNVRVKGKYLLFLVFAQLKLMLCLDWRQIGVCVRRYSTRRSYIPESLKRSQCSLPQKAPRRK